MKCKWKSNHIWTEIFLKNGKIVIKDLDILLKSSFKMHEIPFWRLEIQILSEDAWSQTLLVVCRQFRESPPPNKRGLWSRPC